MRFILALLLSSAVIACSESPPPSAAGERVEFAATSESELSAPTRPESGDEMQTWRVSIQLPGGELPVSLHFSADGNEAWFGNGIERVRVPEVQREADRVLLRFPSFNNHFDLLRQGDRMAGRLVMVKRGYEQEMPVTAERGVLYRFTTTPVPEVNVTGRWETVFTEDDGKQYDAIAVLDQQGARVTGTFLTGTGDYRYLEGELDGRRLRLSKFDGGHAFLFEARLNEEGQLHGEFWSGTRSHETWRAIRNFDARLPDPLKLTYLKPGYDRLRFTFPDLDGRMVSLDDPRFNDQVVLVTLAGTWCPNCADEAALLSEYYRQNRERGLRVVTLLYEHFGGLDRGPAQGRAFRDQFDIEHEILVAGVSDKTLASETLPMLNAILAFPTLIFLDRSGAVRRIHTGFSGPGTGSHYTDFVQEFESFMDTLLAEPLSAE